MRNKHHLLGVAENLKQQALDLLDAGRLPEPVIPPRPKIRRSANGSYELHFSVNNPVACR